MQSVSVVGSFQELTVADALWLKIPFKMFFCKFRCLQLCFILSELNRVSLNEVHWLFVDAIIRCGGEY